VIKRIKWKIYSIYALGVARVENVFNSFIVKLKSEGLIEEKSGGESRSQTSHKQRTNRRLNRALLSVLFGINCTKFGHRSGSSLNEDLSEVALDVLSQPTETFPVTLPLENRAHEEFEGTPGKFCPSDLALASGLSMESEVGSDLVF